MPWVVSGQAVIPEFIPHLLDFTMACTFQRWIVPSRLPKARNLPSGENPTAATTLAWLSGWSSPFPYPRPTAAQLPDQDAKVADT
jgi:hypothetical protein